MRVLRRMEDMTLFSEAFPAVEPPLDAGDTVIVLKPMFTLRGETYLSGDTLEVVGRTTRAPFKLTTTDGNLLIRGKDGEVTVWSNIEWNIHRGFLSRQPKTPA